MTRSGVRCIVPAMHVQFRLRATHTVLIHTAAPSLLISPCAALQILNNGGSAGAASSRWVYVGSEAASITLTELRLLGAGHVRFMPFAPDYDWPGANSSVITIQRISGDGTGMITMLNRTVVAISASPSGGAVIQGATEVDAMQLQLQPLPGSANEFTTIYRRQFRVDDASFSFNVPITTSAGSMLVLPPRVVLQAPLDIGGGLIGAKALSSLTPAASVIFRATAGSRLVTEGLPMEMASYVPGELFVENLYMRSSTLTLVAGTTVTGYNLTFVSSTVNLPTTTNMTARYIEFSGGSTVTLGTGVAVSAVNRTWPGMALSNPNYGWDVPGAMMIDASVTMNNGSSLAATSTLWLRNAANIKIFGTVTMTSDGTFLSGPNVLIDGAGGGFKDGFGPGSRRECIRDMSTTCCLCCRAWCCAVCISSGCKLGRRGSGVVIRSCTYFVLCSPHRVPVSHLLLLRSFSLLTTAAYTGTTGRGAFAATDCVP